MGNLMVMVNNNRQMGHGKKDLGSLIKKKGVGLKNKMMDPLIKVNS